MKSVPRSTGIEDTGNISNNQLQGHLNVKHVKENQDADFLAEGRPSQSSSHVSGKQGNHSNNDADFFRVDRITKPKFKIDLPHSHRTTIWVRFHCIFPEFDTIQRVLRYTILKVCDDVYEAYGSKNLSDLGMLLVTLEREYDADLIFCSELPYFSYNKLLFVSNYTKFMWCYIMSRPAFDPESFEDLKTFMQFAKFGLSFLETNNLSNMSQKTHGPFIACSCERPKVPLKRCDTEAVHVNEGTRSTLCLGLGADCGTTSTYVECRSTIVLRLTFLVRIV